MIQKAWKGGMSNRYERVGPGCLDLAVGHLKRPKSFFEDVDRLVDWRPREKSLKKKLRRNHDPIANPAYPPLAMLKAILLQR